MDWKRVGSSLGIAACALGIIGAMGGGLLLMIFGAMTLTWYYIVGGALLMTLGLGAVIYVSV